MHVVVERLQAEHVQHPAEPVATRLGVDTGERAPHALRAAGRTRRVVHDEAHGAVVGHRRRLARRQLLVRAEARDVTADGETSIGREVDLVGRGGCGLGEACVRDEHLRFAVGQDVRDLGPDKMPVDGDQVEAGLADGKEQVEDLTAVREQHRDGIALLQTHGPQPVHDLVARREQLTRADLVLLGVDECEMVGSGLRDRPEAECRCFIGHRTCSIASGLRSAKPGVQPRESPHVGIGRVRIRNVWIRNVGFKTVWTKSAGARPRAARDAGG